MQPESEYVFKKNYNRGNGQSRTHTIEKMQNRETSSLFSIKFSIIRHKPSKSIIIMKTCKKLFHSTQRPKLKPLTTSSHILNACPYTSLDRLQYLTQLPSKPHPKHRIPSHCNTDPFNRAYTSIQTLPLLITVRQH